MTAARVREASPRLSQLLHGLATWAGMPDPVPVGLSMDSRRVAQGDLFLACQGGRVHAYAFVEQAVRAGACAVVWEDERPSCVQRGEIPIVGVPDLRRRVGIVAERFYGHPSRALRMVGITGTNGKTSCSQFLGQALSADAPCGVIGTLGNGLYGQLTAGTHTTPDAVTLHALLADMVTRGARYAVMEVSSHGLDQGRVAGVSFDVAVFTNLTRDHLDYHGHMDAYAAAKRRLFHMPGLRHAVINADDTFGLRLLADAVPAVHYTSFGMTGVPTVHAYDVQVTPEGLVMQVRSPWGEGEVRAPLIGRFNASNVLAVLSTLLVMDVAWGDAVHRVSQLHSVAGRMERFGGTAGLPLVVVDYAHTPDALEQALEVLREVAGTSRLCCVFGCGGDRDKGKRPLMAAIAERVADDVVITDDNPRREDADAIVQDILSGLRVPRAARVERDRAAAIQGAIARAVVGDVVLVAGKGHEDYQQIGDVRLPFDDRVVVRQALAARQTEGRA